MTTRAPIVDVRGVSKVYRRGAIDVWALQDVSLQVTDGTWLAVMGPSGAGKTTLLNLLAGLDRPSTGEVSIAGQLIGNMRSDSLTDFRRRHIGFVFQFFNLLPTMSAWDNVALPLLAERLPRREIESRTAAMLELVGLTQRATHRPGELSGGEQQRVGIARALVMRPRLLLADEPTGNLDSAAGEQVLTLLRSSINHYGLSIVMVTHAQAAAAAVDRVLIMHDGRLADEHAVARMREPQGSQRIDTCAL